MKQIENELEHSQFVTLTGFSGAGKSVLVYQYSKALSDNNVIVLWISAKFLDFRSYRIDLF